jgi:hydrogenase nickel incorporation protein HypA/HybF
MHEMALCQGMLGIIEEQRVAQDFNRVRRVILEVGALGHVDPHALRFAFDVSVRGTSAEDAALDIIEVPGQAWCMDCCARIAVAHRGEGCPDCGGHTLIMEQGEELRLKELEVV